MKNTGFIAIFILGVFPHTFRSITEAQTRFDKTEKDTLNNNVFPNDFLFGVSISAPQFEGAWNVSGKKYNTDKIRVGKCYL